MCSLQHVETRVKSIVCSVKCDACSVVLSVYHVACINKSEGYSVYFVACIV